MNELISKCLQYQDATAEEQQNFDEGASRGNLRQRTPSSHASRFPLFSSSTAHSSLRICACCLYLIPFTARMGEKCLAHRRSSINPWGMGPLSFHAGKPKFCYSGLQHISFWCALLPSIQLISYVSKMIPQAARSH